MNTPRRRDPYDPLCPSAPPELEGAVIFGVVGGTTQEPRVAHLVQPLPVTDELLALAEPASPRQVYRTAAPCAQSACAHFAENRSTARRRRGTVRKENDMNEHETQITTEEQPMQVEARSVATKLQAFLDGLTPDEQLALERALHCLGASAPAGGEADVQGHMIAEYDDGFGKKGPNRFIEETGGHGSSDVTRGLIWLLVFAGTLGGSAGQIKHPEHVQPG